MQEKTEAAADIISNWVKWRARWRQDEDAVKLTEWEKAELRASV